MDGLALLDIKTLRAESKIFSHILTIISTFTQKARKKTKLNSPKRFNARDQVSLPNQAHLVIA